MVTISTTEYLNWNHHYFATHKARELRLGQAFCNYYNITDPELFYETSYDKARDLIWEKYVTTGC